MFWDTTPCITIGPGMTITLWSSWYSIIIFLVTIYFSETDNICPVRVLWSCEIWHRHRYIWNWLVKFISKNLSTVFIKSLSLYATWKNLMTLHSLSMLLYAWSYWPFTLCTAATREHKSRIINLVGSGFIIATKFFTDLIVQHNIKKHPKAI